METIFVILAIVALILAIAYSLYGRRRDRLVSPHTTHDDTAPQAERRPSEPDHDRTDGPSVQHGAR